MAEKYTEINKQLVKVTVDKLKEFFPIETPSKKIVLKDWTSLV